MFGGCVFHVVSFLRRVVGLYGLYIRTYFPYIRRIRLGNEVTRNFFHLYLIRFGDSIARIYDISLYKIAFDWNKNKFRPWLIGMVRTFCSVLYVLRMRGLIIQKLAFAQRTQQTLPCERFWKLSQVFRTLNMFSRCITGTARNKFNSKLRSTLLRQNNTSFPKFRSLLRLYIINLLASDANANDA